MDFLRDFLADGPKPVSEVYEAGDANGHARITLRRAKGSSARAAIKDGSQGRAGLWEMQAIAEGDHALDTNHDHLRRHSSLYVEKMITFEHVRKEDHLYSKGIINLP